MLLQETHTLAKKMRMLRHHSAAQSVDPSPIGSIVETYLMRHISSQADGIFTSLKLILRGDDQGDVRVPGQGGDDVIHVRGFHHVIKLIVQDQNFMRV